MSSVTPAHKRLLELIAERRAKRKLAPPTLPPTRPPRPPAAIPPVKPPVTPPSTPTPTAPPAPIRSTFKTLITQSGTVLLITGIVEDPSINLRGATQIITVNTGVKVVQPLTRITPEDVITAEDVKPTFRIDLNTDSYIILPNIPEKHIPSIRIDNTRLTGNRSTPSGHDIIGWSPGNLGGTGGRGLTATFKKQYGFLDFQDMAAVKDPAPGFYFDEDGTMREAPP